MGTYQNALNAVEGEMKKGVDSLYSSYLKQLEKNTKLIPDIKAKQDHDATAKYRTKSDTVRQRAISKETALFADLRRDVEAALTTAPTQEQINYLQALSLKPSLKKDDLDKAAIALKGNAIAEANISALAEREGFILLNLEEPPVLMDVLTLIDEFEESRKNSISCYLEVKQDGDRGEGLHSRLFTPGCGWSKAMEVSERVLDRYGSQG